MSSRRDFLKTGSGLVLAAGGFAPAGSVFGAGSPMGPPDCPPARSRLVPRGAAREVAAHQADVPAAELRDPARGLRPALHPERRVLRPLSPAEDPSGLGEGVEAGDRRRRGREAATPSTSPRSSATSSRSSSPPSASARAIDAGSPPARRGCRVGHRGHGQRALEGRPPEGRARPRLAKKDALEVISTALTTDRSRHAGLHQEHPDVEGDGREHAPRLADERRAAAPLQWRTGPDDRPGMGRDLLDEAHRLHPGLVAAVQELLDGQPRTASRRASSRWWIASFPRRPTSTLPSPTWS